MPKRAVLFDLDGVLTDTRELHRGALNAALSFFGYPTISLQDHTQVYNGQPTKQKLTAMALKDIIPFHAIADIAAKKQELTAVALKTQVQFDPEIYCLCAGLVRGKFLLGVVTNSITKSADTVLKNLGIRKLVSTLVTNQHGKPKPCPDLYRVAMARLRVKPKYCVVVEDHDYGVQAAHAAGIKTVLRVTSPKDVTPTLVFGAFR